MFIDKPEEVSTTQKAVEHCYYKHGCDHWRWYNSMVGGCTCSPTFDEVMLAYVKGHKTRSDSRRMFALKCRQYC